MEPVIKEIAQILIITEDLEAAVKRYYDELGIGPWYFYQFGPNGNKLAVCDALNIQLELLQPDPSKPQHQWLEKHGQSIQQIVFNPNVEYIQAKQALQKMGGIVTNCSKDGSGAENVFFDMTQTLGFRVEMHDRNGEWAPPPPDRIYPEGAVFQQKR